jgi:hypothetical protein
LECQSFWRNWLGPLLGTALNRISEPECSVFGDYCGFPVASTSLKIPLVMLFGELKEFFSMFLTLGTAGSGSTFAAG